MSRIRTKRSLLVIGVLLAAATTLPAIAQSPAARATHAAYPDVIRTYPSGPLVGPIVGPNGPVNPVNPVNTISPANPFNPPDSNLFATYSFSNVYSYVNWVVCGSTQASDGCYDSGNLGPFGHAGALIEGNESVSGNTVTRNIYVVDDAANGGTGVVLHVYTKTDTVTPTFDTCTITPVNTVTLPLTGGANAKTYIAANNGNLYIGTNQSQSAAVVQKSSLAVGQIGGFSPPINVSSITANKYGFVTVTFGTTNGFSGFYAFDPNGNFVEDGGGADYLLSNSNGLSTANLVSTSTSANLAARMKIRFKKIAPQNTTGH